MTPDYPEDEDLQKIRDWKIGGHADALKLLEFVDSIYPEMGSFADESTSSAFVYVLTTGGWSGCEDIVSAMAGNLVFWGTCWHMSKRGGLHEFVVPRSGR